MVRSKIQKDFMKMLKNVKKVGAKYAKSTVTLYAVLVLAVINLFVLINNQDNESLFLFLVISTIIYMKTNNMIVVLLVPLLTVNLLIYLRALLMNRREGFSSKEIMLTRFVDFVKQNKDDEPRSKDEDGIAFYDKFVKPIREIEDLDPENLKNISVKGMEDIISLFRELYNKTDDSKSDYVKNMLSAFNEKFEDLKENPDSKEAFTILEGYEDEEDDEEEVDEEELDEEELDEEELGEEEVDEEADDLEN